MKLLEKISPQKLTIFGTVLAIIGVVLTVYSIFDGKSSEKRSSEQLNSMQKILNDKDKEIEELQKKNKIISWEQVELATYQLAKQLERDTAKFKPDFIFTPGQRGGFFAYLLLTKYYKGYNIPVFTGYMRRKGADLAVPEAKESYICYTEKDNKWYILFPKELQKRSNQKILIVDDCINTGDAMNMVKNWLYQADYKEENIKTCVIITIDTDIADYYWDKGKQNEFHFLWDFTL
jgi:hypoxanthine phosphoribosyltransferase